MCRSWHGCDILLQQDFHIKLRKKLHTCYQGNRTVRDYLYELNEMWNMIRETDERTKVHKLWFGL